MTRPKTLPERIVESHDAREAAMRLGAGHEVAPLSAPIGLIFPHCDSRVLHHPDACMYCADATWLQDERAALDVSHTGTSDRRWPCPADEQRGAESLNSWGGNRPAARR